MPLFYHKYVNYVLAHSVNYVITLYRAVKSLVLIPLVVSLVNIDRCTHSNSELEKCCPTKRTIGGLLSWSKLNDIAEVHQAKDFFTS